jgi:drug/metabolite transporter (DMT)-like permease
VPLRVSEKKSNAAIGASLVLAVFLWGANNTGTKVIVTVWPPIWAGGTRFLCAGLLLLGVLRWTNWLGGLSSPGRKIQWLLWSRGGLSLAVYIAVFNWAVRFTSASHVALYLGASPVWALLWEEGISWNRNALRRQAAALLALTGVFVQFWPALKSAGGSWQGEALGLAASLLWTAYGVQCRSLGASLSGAEISAHTMWRAGVLMLAMALFERRGHPIVWRADLLWIQLYCILAGGVAAFAIWSNALRQWPASQVLLFNNLIPLSTMAWSHFCLHEAVTPTFWVAMVLVAAGVILGQTDWHNVLRNRLVPPE